MSIVVVTGASSGIGKATVQTLRADNVPVLAVARREERLAQLTKDTGFEYVVADLTTPQGAQAVKDAVGERGVKAVIANAGGARGVDPVTHAREEAVIERWREMYEINVISTLRTVTTILPHLRKAEGDIVRCTSLASRQC